MFDNFTVPENLIPSDPRFGCGPSLIPTDFVMNLYKTGPHLLGTSHRKPAVKNLVKEVQEGLLKYFKLDPQEFLVVLGNGGSTLLFDMIALGLVEKKISHFTYSLISASLWLYSFIDFETFSFCFTKLSLNSCILSWS